MSYEEVIIVPGMGNQASEKLLNLLWVTQDMDAILDPKAVWLQIFDAYLLYSNCGFQEIFCSVILLEPKLKAIINVVNLKPELERAFTKHSGSSLFDFGILTDLVKTCQI